MNFLDADRLPGKDGTEVNLLVPQTDASAVGDDNGLVVEGIINVGQSLIGAGGGLIDLGWALHVQGFVWALVVADLDEFVEPGLLPQEVSTCRLGGFFLQGKVHAFMASVLLRMSRFDPFNADAQTQPLDRQFALIKQGVSGSEGNAIIAAHVGG